MPGMTVPPFPAGIPTQPLTVIDYALIKAGDEAEIDALWNAATKKGFWYLKNHGVDDLLRPMFDLGQETLDLPLEDKMAYWQGNTGGSFGYKAIGATTVDLEGSKDNAEMINISKDDALAWPASVHAKYPKTVEAHMEDTVRPFVAACLEANNTLLEVFNSKLGLPNGALTKRHSMEEHSVSEARVIKVPASPGSTKIAVGAHTDFGSISFLANRLGGLQVMLPGQDTWSYVKPLPGHVICNIGDALNLLSGGILMSSIHRVLPPPLEQSHHDRWSLVFFTRPGNSVPLRALTDESDIINDAVAKSGRDFESGQTAGEWFKRRQAKWRVDGQKGVRDYLASRGTEHTIVAV